MGLSFPCFANEEAESEEGYFSPQSHIHFFSDRSRKRNIISPYLIFFLVHWVSKIRQVNWVIEKVSYIIVEWFWCIHIVLHSRIKKKYGTDWSTCICRQMLQWFSVLIWNVECIPYFNFHGISGWKKWAREQWTWLE